MNYSQYKKNNKYMLGDVLVTLIIKGMSGHSNKCQ